MVKRERHNTTLYVHSLVFRTASTSRWCTKVKKKKNIYLKTEIHALIQRQQYTTYTDEDHITFSAPQDNHNSKCISQMEAPGCQLGERAHIFSYLKYPPPAP